MMNSHLTDQKVADNLRILSLSMVEQAQSGHPGGAMGAAEFIHVLYSEFLRFHPGKPEWHARDRFFLDPGHMSPMMYSILALLGKYSMEDLRRFRSWGSVTPGHPERDIRRMIENTSGPLGQGHAMAVGSAIAERFLVARFGSVAEHKTVAFISDGGIQEEISQGAGRIAGFLGLSNLIMYYDANQVQLSTRVDEVTCEDTAAKYKAWGWKVYTINGNHSGEIRKALTAAWNETEAPVLIIGNSIMGKGILNSREEPMEGLTSTHGQPISKAGADVELTIRSLGGIPREPFRIFDEVKEFYQQVISRKTREAEEIMAIEKEWEEARPVQARHLRETLMGKIPSLPWEEIGLKPDAATRATSAEILSFLGKHLDNMLVMSADLANSDRTDGFLKHQQPIRKGHFEGGFLHAGVSELTMAALANGMALHGGIIPVCGTFFVFSDYMKPAIRLSALMELPVIYIWSHDAFRVGEDGPTHQPVEQETQIRLMEQVKNHSGNRSFLALRPADAAETLAAWRLALETPNRPTGMILSRQNVPSLKAPSGTERLSQAFEIRKGAYILSDPGPDFQLILLANGSEVSLLVEVAQQLTLRRGITARVVSIPSPGLFLDQDTTCRNTVLPKNKPIFGLTAGLPQVFAGLAHRTYGLEHFGYSAPANVLDEKFGFTVENIIFEVQKFLNEYQVTQ